MNWVNAPFEPKQNVNLGLFALLGIVVLYVLVYFLRSKRCPICTKKLVVFPNRCYICIFVGAEMPDPVMMKILEAKGNRLLLGEMKPKLTYKKTIILMSRNFKKIMGDCFCCFCRLKNGNSTVHVLEGSKKGVKSRTVRDSLDLEYQGGGGGEGGIDIDSPEKQYYMTDKDDIEPNGYEEKNARDEIISELDTPIVESSKVPFKMKSLFNRKTPELNSLALPGEEVIENAIERTVSKKRNSGKIMNKSIKKMSVFKESIISRPRPKMRKIIKKFYAPERNPHLLRCSKDIIIDTVDREFRVIKTKITKVKPLV
jgi:hypothetical protein